jgi:hypothetical protein
MRRIIIFPATSFILTSIVYVAVAFAGDLNTQQVQSIKDMATTICNTVTEARGQKTDTQIQGEIKAQLGGIIGKFADVGGSGKGSMSREEFEGLTREATASAMEGDRGCRERVFNKMFDKLSSSLIPTTLHVATVPDTVGIPPGGYHAIT